MPIRNYRKTSKKTKKSFRSKRPKKSRGVSLGVKKYVKKIISKNIENKVISAYDTNKTLQYAGALIQPTYLFLTPNLSQGLGARLGNEINMVKGIIKGYVNILPYNITSNPMTSPVYVKMWLCKRKTGSVEISGGPGAAAFNTFFQSGISSSGFQGNMLDMTFNNNKDYWTIFNTKTIQLSPSMINISTPTSQTLPTSSNVSVPFNFSFAKHLGRMKFNDTSSVCTNKELFLVFQTVYADGTYLSLGGPFCEIHYCVEWEYEDA